MIIDSHCHLDYPSLYDQLDQVINRAEKNDIKYLLTICTSIESYKKIELIVNKYKNIYGTFGIHPHETKNHIEVDKKFIINKKKENNKIIGIGETGLDFYYNHSEKKIQIKSFIEHINAASELGIPIIVHSRNAEVETYDILKTEMKNKNLKVLLHCFTGSGDFAKKILDLNCYISISGIITFNKSDDLAEVVSNIPINKLLVETDSPYLAPVPYRGKNNEPSFIKHTISKISKIKKILEKEVINNTSKNFIDLFDIN